MKKYKILLFILLMIFATNVYAYNWCKGGTGTNAYNFCDQQIYYYGDFFNSSSYADQFMGDKDTGFYSFRDILNETKNHNSYYIAQYTHYTDKRRDKAGTFFAIETYAICNGSCDAVPKNYQYFRASAMKDLLDAADDSQAVTDFNNGVKKTSVVYYTDYQHKIADRSYVKIDHYTYSNKMHLIYVQTDLGDITNAFGKAPTLGEHWSYSFPSESNKPDEVYYNASKKSVLNTKGSGDVTLKRADLLNASSMSDTGNGYNWCKGGEGFNQYNFCYYTQSSDNLTDCDGVYSGRTLQDIISQFDFNETQTPLRPFGLTSGNGSAVHDGHGGGGAHFGEGSSSGGYLLSIVGCPNGVCDAYLKSDCSRDYYYMKPYTNKYLLKNSDFAVSYNSNVTTESKIYRDATKEHEIKITIVTSPVLDVNGLITSNYNKILLIENHSSAKINDISNKPGNVDFLDWLNQRYVSWPKNIYATTDTSGWTIRTSQFNGSTRFYDGSTGTEEIERIPIDLSDCAGVPRVKTLIERYLIKALHIVAPILLFVLTTLDFVKGVFSGQKELNKAVQSFVKRALVLIIVFFAGNIINMLFELAGIESCGTVETEEPDIVEADIVEREYIDDSLFED